ncbi:MAG: SdrD B-like domain-containing protein, partial [Bacteroidota bacterium]
GASDPLTGQPAGLGVVGVNGSGGRALSADRTQPTNDPAAFDQVGKVGLGDLEISADGRFLFVANLYSRRIFRLELNDPANPTGVIAVESWAIDDIPNVPTCNDGTLRPFGLRYYRGKLYIGAVCTNEERATSIAGNTDLSAHIFVLNEPEAAGYFSAGAIISQTLDYTKGRSRGSQIEGFQNNIWNSWTNDFSSPFGKYPVQEVYPTPLLSDIEFTEEGNMIIAFSDRAAHQFGYNNRPLTGTSTRRYQMGGHLLFAERRPDGTYELESDGKTTNYGVAAAIRSNGEGPGGGEFFSGAFFTSGDNNPYPPNPFSGNHPSTAMGGISVLKGTGELFTTAMDAANLHSGGTLRLNNSNGGKIVGSGYQLYQGTQTSFFGKAAGLGDVTSNVPDAPLEIGNYVWCDSIQNGIQDACERGVDSLIVRLYDRNNNLVGQDTTVNGNYYFNLSNVDTTGITIDANGIATPTTGWTGLSHNTDYQIVFGFGQYQNSDGTFQVGSQVYPGFTTFNAGDNDELDSDVEGTTFFTFSGGKPRFYPEINMRTAATGCGDHRYDLGLLCGEIVYSLGNQVFLDNDNSGDLNGAETGIDGVQLRLLNSDQTVYDSDENTAGIQPLVVTTANGGYYRFDE